MRSDARSGTIADAATVDVFRGLVAGVRRGTPLRIETRCDSPSLIRCVEMTIAPLSRDRVGFHSRLVGARFRVRPEPAADGDPVAPLEICTSCFRVDRGGWRDIEDVVAAEGLLARAALPEVSHGICADCLSAPADELRAGDLVAG